MIGIHLKIVGVVLIGLSLLHIIFPRYFKWKDDLKTASLINRQIMGVHTFFIAVTVFLMGWLCLAAGADLWQTRLGRMVCFGLALFWIIRLFVQFFGYSSRLWRGKRFETGIHILFILLWVYISSVFISATIGSY